VHRDIKTDNLLLCEDANGIHAKIADFGLSKIRKNNDHSVTMGIGTYKYMAPEMTTSEDGLYSEKATDIYAIGMTFVVLVNEEEPYADKKNGIHIPTCVSRGTIWQTLAKNNCSSSFFKLTNWTLDKPLHLLLKRQRIKN